MRDTLERALVSRWYRPRPALWLMPLAWLYTALAALAWLPWRIGLRQPWRAPCPVLVVGNLIVGGAGKTPTVIALVRALQADGWHPGVVSRGHGRHTRGVQHSGPDRSAQDIGDEPWLIARVTGVPVVVGERRVEAAQALLRANTGVDLLIADDGLQHHALGRDVELWVFDERGTGNGARLPAGPLRQALPGELPPGVRVLYNAPTPSTPLPGATARRTLAGAVLLTDWLAGQPMDPAALAALRGRPVLAIAGIAAPGRFFGMLRESGLDITPLALPDHADLAVPPWPPDTPEVLCTEKDAAKLDPAPCAGTRVWVVGLDFGLPRDLTRELGQLLARQPTRP